MIEVERKAWVDNPVDLESRVKRIARLQKKERMIDFYFTPRKESHPIDNCFRIRLEDKSAWVTFKRKKIVRRSEVNEEMNKEIRNPVLLARLYNGDAGTALRAVLGTSLVSLVTIPLWISAGMALFELPLAG